MEYLFIHGQWTATDKLATAQAFTKIGDGKIVGSREGT